MHIHILGTKVTPPWLVIQSSSKKLLVKITICLSYTKKMGGESNISQPLKSSQVTPKNHPGPSNLPKNHPPKKKQKDPPPPPLEKNTYISYIHHSLGSKNITPPTRRGKMLKAIDRTQVTFLGQSGLLPSFPLGSGGGVSLCIPKSLQNTLQGKTRHQL